MTTTRHRMAANTHRSHPEIPTSLGFESQEGRAHAHSCSPPQDLKGGGGEICPHGNQIPGGDRRENPEICRQVSLEEPQWHPQAGHQQGPQGCQLPPVLFSLESVPVTELSHVTGALLLQWLSVVCRRDYRYKGRASHCPGPPRGGGDSRTSLFPKF